MAYPSSNTALQGWHPGELYVQEKLGFVEASKDKWSYITNHMPDQHRRFHSSNLHFLPVTTEDPETGRVWSTFLLPAHGDDMLHVSSPTPQELVIRARLVAGDPAIGNLVNGAERIAGVGIEMSTRRRNKFAGRVLDFQRQSAQGAMTIHVDVNEAVGNCPKYINVRSFVPAPYDAPDPVAQSYLDLSPSDPLPSSFVDFIHRCDTLFIGTTFHPSSPDPLHPTHLGNNHRGGMPGFCRVLSKPGQRSVVHIPDYSGNRLMTSLGNIASTPMAGVAFPDFSTGDVLYVTGKAELLFGDEADAVMPRIRCLARIYVAGAVLIKAAMPFRADAQQPTETSPYTPPVRYLVEEPQSASMRSLGKAEVKLVGVEMFPSRGETVEEATLARFDFETREEVTWKAGQYAILDLTDLVGKVPYQHMTRDGQERSVNDDGIRTWTISSVPGADGALIKTFSMTMRLVPNGRITTMLFRLARALTQRCMSPRNLEVKIALHGIGGDFTLSHDAHRLLFIGGGIGVTPALAFLRSLRQSGRAARGKDVELWLACRSAELPAFARLVRDALGERGLLYKFRLRLFITSSSGSDAIEEAPNLEPVIYAGRLARASISQDAEQLRRVASEREAYLCGPPAFEESAVEALGFLGLEAGRIKRESFAF